MGRLRLSHPDVFMRGQLLPVAYCLLYVLYAIRYACESLIPAIQGNFPNTRVQDFFHFCQAVLCQEISENANGISIFASKPCTHGFRNLKYWDIRSSINLVPGSGSGFQPLKFRFGMCMVGLCKSTTIWKCANHVAQPHEQKSTKAPPGILEPIKSPRMRDIISSVSC
ncbi:hypothetical protein T4B_1858 [Trichinella pseudospiralis]|uniref:Uncharacterized protein n=1 Tax=Trichinella pseudospiralis TaxID=6337 RepID=A0A0V1JQ39_TRIPS|nr:hypothetical protein T4B_1858 [Trichinella pseudospiralis]KRZ37060.1 hypothetical protein T4C_12012 [Trichinella pseudospiralis]